MIPSASRWLTLAWAALVLMGAAARGGAAAAEGDSIAKALAEVRGVKADMFAHQSSVLGKLPGPAELAAAQADRRTAFPPGTPLEVAFTDKQRAAFQKAYAKPAFKGRSRMATCFPVGVTGVHVRDIRDRIELVVVAIEEGSPADGKVRVNDILIGANGRLFDDPMDPRPQLGFALVGSQTRTLGGKLTLQLVRGGEPMNVALQLPVAEPYSRTWPDGCERTRQVTRAALGCVVHNAPTARNLHNLHGGGGFWTPLFLMASGDPAAMDLTVRWIYHQAQHDAELPTIPGGNNWVMSYNLVNLCEYYQLTGDSAVLPKIRTLSRQIELNQYKNVGSWGHGMPTGYGPINNVGLICFIGLILTRECGIEVDSEVMCRAVRFFGKFCGTNFPYGEGSPGGRSGRMDNGMNSMAAVAFHLLGEEAMAERWARSVCYMWLGREKGHAERIFATAWGPLGARLAPSPEFHAFMNNMLWYYELMRTRDDGFVFSSYGSASKGRFPYPSGTTAAIALSFYLPQGRLRILGAPRGVFAQPPPKGLEKAAELFRQKKWDELATALKPHLASTREPAHSFARGLAAARQRIEDHFRFTMGLARKNVRDDPFVAMEQLNALKSLIGHERKEMADLALDLPNEIRRRKRKADTLKAVVKPDFRLFAK